MKTNVLLSIIIPTKNRQFTCLYAIESALDIGKDDVEIIVQDCSDTNILQKQILDKFGVDERIKYQYNDTKPSMTDNWNNAFARATGEYLCGIGDDDAVLPRIYETTEWAKAQDVLSVTQKVFVVYTWPGFNPQPFNGTLAFDTNNSDRHVVIDDLEKRVIDYSTLINAMSYINLPQAYHCIFSRKIKEQLEELTGEFLKSTSLDIYTAVAFNKFIKSYVEVDFPFTIRGASKNSNSQRLFDGRSKEHFNEFKNLNYPEILPKTVGLHITAAESLIRACESTKQEQLINNIDLPILYANIALEDKANFQLCEDKLKEYVSSSGERKRFYKHYRSTKRKKFILKVRTDFFSFLKKVTPFVYKAYRRLVPLQVTRTVVHAETIKDALVFFARK